jgi:hypothetical protein
VAATAVCFVGVLPFSVSALTDEVAPLVAATAFGLIGYVTTLFAFRRRLRLDEFYRATRPRRHLRSADVTADT